MNEVIPWSTKYLASEETFSNFMENETKIFTTSIGIRNVDLRCDANDKIFKQTFSSEGSDWNNNLLKVIEKGKGKDKKKVAVATIKIRLNSNINEVFSGFTPFDREVCLAVMSEQWYGQKYATISGIYRVMVGDCNSENKRKKPRKNMEIKVEESVQKMMATMVELDYSDACQKFGYNEGEPFRRISPILPIEYLKGIVVNGKRTNVIYFRGPCPLLELAKIKNSQVLTYNKMLLSVPIQNTELLIPLKSYILRRITEIKLHKKLKPFITFKDVFEKNNLLNIDNHKKRE